MRLATLLPAPLMTLALALPAYAAPAPAAAPDPPSVVSVQDGRGDMWRIVNRAGQDPRWTRARGHRTGDVVGVRVAHRPAVVVARIRQARLERRNPAPLVLLRTPVASVAVLVDRVGTRLTTRLFTTYGGDAIDCPGAATTVRRARRTVVVTVPRTCLGQPGWVRSRTVSYHVVRTDRRGYVAYADVVPGRGHDTFGRLSRRAVAPAGAAVADARPPLLPADADRAGARLDRLGLLR